MIKKKVCLCLLASAILYGCSSSPRQSIPVVEAGGPLTPGAMRDLEARQQAMRNEGAPVAYGAPEAGYVKPQQGPLPSAPIQAEESDVQPVQVPQTSVAVPAQPSGTPAVTAAPVQAEQQVSRVAQQIDAPVVALLSTAQQQQNAGDLNGAAASLERAQRIAPREPRVLYRLAEVHLAQGDAQQAEQIARRGLSLSSGQPALQAGLWDLIADALDKQGNAAGAAQAREKARVRL